MLNHCVVNLKPKQYCMSIIIKNKFKKSSQIMIKLKSIQTKRKFKNFPKRKDLNKGQIFWRLVTGKLDNIFRVLKENFELRILYPNELPF